MENFSEIDIYQIIDDEDLAILTYIIEEYNICENGKYLDKSLLHIAATKGKITTCKFLIDKGVSVNVVDDLYLTPLVESAAAGHLDVLIFLLKAGAWIDGDPRGITTPLIEASLKGYVDIVNFLIKNNANINRFQVKFNCTALDIANAYDQQDIVSVLISNGAKKAFEIIETENIEGSGILSYIHNNAGAIVSEEYNKNGISVKIALIGSLSKKYVYNKLVFTFGNFVKIPRKEFLICLPYDWAINTQIVSKNFAEAFPLQFLFLLSDLYEKGLEVTEGTVFDKNDINWNKLKWSENIDALIVVDHLFTLQEKNQEFKDETVDLLLLVPIKYTKAGKPKGDKLKKWIDKKKVAKWSNVSFKK